VLLLLLLLLLLLTVLTVLTVLLLLLLPHLLLLPLLLLLLLLLTSALAQVLEWLAGEDVNLLTQQPDTGYSCALLAAEHGHFNCLKKIHELAGRELLRAADVLRASDLDGFTSAHWAVQNGRSDMLTWLVQVGGTQILKAADKTGATVVMEAASNDHLNIVKWIVSQIGSDCLRTVDDDGETAVFDACGGDCQAVVEYIAETLGIDNALRVMNKAGLTPLNYLENLEGTEHAQPAMLTHLKKLLVVPDDLPEMWHATWDPGEGRYYFWHEDTKTPQWDKPTGPPPGWVRKAAPAPAPVPQAVPQAVPQQVPQYMQQPAAVPQYQQQPFGAPAMGMGACCSPCCACCARCVCWPRPCVCGCCSSASGSAASSSASAANLPLLHPRRSDQPWHGSRPRDHAVGRWPPAPGRPAPYVEA